ncbi:MAG: NAD(P)H-dependent oxidoreductase [Bacteroidales bacterium]|nr:NAD(P)H-dependent oxidoreductase [Bacteroidales bacterium]
MKLLNLFVAGWAALASVTASCSTDPMPVKDPQINNPEAETPAQKDDIGQNSSEDPQKPETTGSNTLVVWYSFTGNSTAIVQALRSHIKADALEVKPAAEGLDYAANNYAIGSSLIAAIRNNPSSASSYPAIKDVEVSFDDYGTIIIVTPLWWSQMAAPMQSFLFKYGGKMAGKTIGLIVTSASSGISGVEQDAKRLVPDGKFVSESLWIRSSQVSNAKELTSAWYDKMFKTNNGGTSMKVKITAGGKSFTAAIEDSETGNAFMGKLPMTLEMSELNGNEKYCYGVSLPNNDKRYDSIEAGDLMLYSGNCIVLFYGSAGGYNYTRIGKISDVTGLSNAVGSGSVTVKFEKQ